jgi:segregation and condensation protein B
MTTLSQAIEAILFATSEPQKIETLAQRLSVSTEEIGEAITDLVKSFEDHGIMVLLHNDSVTLVTTAAQSELIESIRKEELNKELSKASAETLAIIAYTPGVTKSQIEFIRGVNASYSVRALQMRGLIEQQGTGRALSYHPTLALLAHFGISELSELPDYTATKTKIEHLLTGADTSQS